MFQGLFDKLSPHSTTAELFMWQWANNHPVLFTVIKISETNIYILVAGMLALKLVNGVFRKNK